MAGKLKNKKGFTLIELIVVMAVIGILVLMAAPKFLGHTKEASATAVKADTAMLSNISLIYNMEKGKWPVTSTVPAITDTALSAELDSATKFALDPVLKSEYKTLKNKFEDYFIVTSGVHQGKVFYGPGAEDKAGNRVFNETIKTKNGALVTP